LLSHLGLNTAFKTRPEFGVRNAYDRAWIAGGSSSGTCRDRRADRRGGWHRTRRSVRVPAALRMRLAAPDPRTLSASGGIAPISHSRDTAGPMAATMRMSRCSTASSGWDEVPR